MHHALVFVYGSLRRGLHNHRLLTDYNSEFVDLARTEGDTWTMTEYCASFPAVYDGGTEKIFGEIYGVSAECLAHLDTLEGHPLWYRRTECRFTTKENGVLHAFIYVMNGVPEPRHQVIRNGARGTASWNRHLCAGHFDT
jgi:gamma-glutamylaminecyclotransferase